MFSVQPETAVASYSPARQKPARGDQPSGSDNFGALVDSNAITADIDRPAGNQSDMPVRSGERDERQVKKTDAADNAAEARPASQDNPDQGTQAAEGKKQSNAGGKNAAENSDASKKATVSNKSGGKIKAGRDTKDITDAANTDPTAETAASTIIPTNPAALVVIAASTSVATISAGETPASAASAIAPTAAVTTTSPTTAKTETAMGAETDAAQPAVPAMASPDQTSAQPSTNAATQAVTDKAIADNNADFTSPPDDASTDTSANGKVAADPSALHPQDLSAVASEVTLPAGVELAAHSAIDEPAPIVRNGKTTAALTVKSAVLTKADAKDEAPQTVSAAHNKDAKTDATGPAETLDTDDSDAKTAKGGKGADGSDTMAASPDRPAAAPHEPRITAQPLTTDPSLQQLNAQQQPTQLQPSNTSATPTAQLNATLASANTPVPLNSLAVDIALRAASGNSRFEIRLDPAELGRIDVRLDVDKHGQVTSHLTVERPATLDMLRKDAPQLQQALENAGLKTGEGGLQFSLRDQSSGQQNNDQSGRNSQRLIITEDAPVPAQIAGQTYGRALGSRSGVDISI